MKVIINQFLNKDTLTKSVKRQFILFFVIGGICFAIDLSILTLLIELVRFGVILSTALSFIFVAYVNYLLSIKYIFINGKYEKKKEITGFYFIAIIAFFLNIILMYLLTTKMDFHYFIAKIVTVLLVAILTFTFKKYFLFIK